MPEVDPEEIETKEIHALVDLRRKSVLEIGAGDGRFTWRLAQRAKSILALDPNEPEIKRARETAPRKLRSRVRFEVADATTYTYPASRFDVVVLSFSL